MGHTAETKRLSEEIVSSFKQRIKENEELVIEVQKTLKRFNNERKDMVNELKANAVLLRKELDKDNKNRLENYNGLMSVVQSRLSSIRNEVESIQTSAYNMLDKFSEKRKQMTLELKDTFKKYKGNRENEENERVKEFDNLMEKITKDIKSINNDVLIVVEGSQKLLERYKNERSETSAELWEMLNENLNERVNYTKLLLQGFNDKLAEIGSQNQQMAQKLSESLAKGEADRLKQYNKVIKSIRTDLKEIKKQVSTIKRDTSEMLNDFSKDRSKASVLRKEMQEEIARAGKKDEVSSAEIPTKKPEIKKIKEHVKEEAPKEKVSREEQETKITLGEKVLNYINQHPGGIRVTEMEIPLGESRLRIGYVAKKLFDEGKVLKVDNLYFPLKQ